MGLCAAAINNHCPPDCGVPFVVRRFVVDGPRGSACRTLLQALLNTVQIFHQKHAAEKKGRWVSGNAVFFRMNRILDIYFVGGFGTVQWVDVEEYTSVQPDKVVLEMPNHTLQVCSTTRCRYAQPHAAVVPAMCEYVPGAPSARS